MKFLKSFFNFYVDASVHVALAVFSLTYISLTKLDLPYTEVILGFNFFGTILGYNFVKYASTLFIDKFRLTLKMKLIVLLAILSLILLFFYGFQLKINSIYVLSVAFLITAMYGAISYPFKRRIPSLRNLPGLKIFFIALVWSIVIVLFPVIELHNAITKDAILLAIQIFLIVIALMLPFEIRDLEFDNKNLHTLPQVIGVKKTKIIGFLIVVALIFIELLYKETTTKHVYCSIVVFVILMFAIICSKSKQPKYYSSFFVEAIPILWLLLLLIF